MKRRYSKQEAAQLTRVDLARLPISYQKAYNEYTFSRRSFLKGVAATAASVFLSGSYRPPTLAEAQTSPQWMQILSGANGTSIYSRTGETDAEINALFNGLEPAFWRRASNSDPQCGIDIFAPTMDPVLFTP